MQFGLNCSCDKCSGGMQNCFGRWLINKILKLNCEALNEALVRNSFWYIKKLKQLDYNDYIIFLKFKN